MRRLVPAVGRVLTHPLVRPIVARMGHELTARLVRQVIEEYHADSAGLSSEAEAFESVCRSVVEREQQLGRPSLRRVLNATGIVIHTNLGRAPLSRDAAAHLSSVAQGYTNLELDLTTGKRGNRQDHLRDILRLLTGAEDVLVVNNNAAALLLVMRALAFRREVIVSRGELIEIGDSFRLPDVLSASGARLVEVGSTNRTHLGDYEAAIGPRTAVLLKAHTSNYRTIGFCSAVSVSELADLARSRGLPCVYDLGSGMLRRPSGLALGGEPSVAEALAAGADLITCSGDKLLGAAQAGLIAGRRGLVASLRKTPLLRALRPGRLTIAALEAVVRQYLDEARLRADNPVFRMLARSADELRQSAERLHGLLADAGIEGEIVPSEGQVGGGALPGVPLPGWAVKLSGRRPSPGSNSVSVLAGALLRGDPSVLVVLREGSLVIDVRTLEDEQLAMVADAVRAASAAACSP